MKHRLLGLRFDIDHPIGMQSGLGECRRKQVAGSQAPEDGSGQTAENSGDEEGRDRPVDSLQPAAGNLVESAQGQAATGQGSVDLAHPER